MKAQLLVTAYYRFDTISNFSDVYNIEAEALGDDRDQDAGERVDLHREEERQPDDQQTSAERVEAGGADEAPLRFEVGKAVLSGSTRTRTRARRG